MGRGREGLEGGARGAFRDSLRLRQRGRGLRRRSFTKATPEEIRWLFSVNSLGAFHTVRSLLPSMLAHGKSGHIVCTASVAAIEAAPGWHIGFYAGTKAAVAMMAQSMRDDIGDAPIGVSVVYPGLVNTNIGANASQLRPKGGAEAKLPAGLDTTQESRPTTRPRSSWPERRPGCATSSRIPNFPRKNKTSITPIYWTESADRVK